MNKLLIVVLMLSLFISSNAIAVEIKYPVSEIPDSLLKNAKAVIRDYSIQFEMLDLGNIVETITTATTIIDRSADSYAIGFYPYSKDEEITKIEAFFYSKDGILLKKINRNDFKDESYDTYGILFSDNRYLKYKPLTAGYPYTVEYKVTYRQNNSYSFPSWFPISESDVSVQKSSLTVTIPQDYKLAIKEVSLPNSHTTTSVDRKTILYWEVRNLMALEDEVYLPSYLKFLSYVMIKPTNFTYNKYKGSMDSWSEMGKFYTTLNAGLTDLNPETIDKINHLIAGCSSNIEKTKVLYNYIQGRTRYVNISIGIGGIQTVSAKSVDQYGYGDCKGLSNYMKAVLEVAGIKSYHAYVKAGAKKYFLDTDFVSHQFNHNILCVPIESDTLWLECTSQIMPFGYLGDNTDNRNALIITEDGGKLVKTKEYTHAMNLKNCTAKVNLSADGSAIASIKTSYEGLEYDNILYSIHSDYKTQKDNLYKRIDIPDFKIDSFDYKDYPAIDPIGEELLNLNLINYSSVSGSRMFVTLNLMNRFDDVPPKDEDRKNPIAIFDNFIYTDSIYYIIPEGYKIEFIPENSTLVSDFADVFYTFSADNTKILYTRKLEFYRREHSKEKYNEFVSFCKSLKKADVQKLVLVKVE